MTTDWIPNQFLIYAYDTVAKCFIYANHDLRNGASIVQPIRNIPEPRRERLDRGEEADARKQSLLARSRWDLFGKYEKLGEWRMAWIEGAFIIESYNCKDQQHQCRILFNSVHGNCMAAGRRCPQQFSMGAVAWGCGLGRMDT